jgi:hypothetical protein
LEQEANFLAVRVDRAYLLQVAKFLAGYRVDRANLFLVPMVGRENGGALRRGGLQSSPHRRPLRSLRGGRTAEDGWWWLAWRAAGRYKRCCTHRHVDQGKPPAGTQSLGRRRLQGGAKDACRFPPVGRSLSGGWVATKKHCAPRHCKRPTTRPAHFRGS